MIEHHVFRLAADADEAAFVDADKRVQVDVAYKQPGLLRRTLARGTEGDWLVATLWASTEHADASAPIMDALLPHIDVGSLRVRRWEPLPG